MSDIFPVSRLQIPHLVAAKSSEDETADFVTISRPRILRSRKEAYDDWINLVRMFPNLRSKFLRRGREIYQEVLDVGDCLERFLVQDGGDLARSDLDSFVYPSIYVWDRSSGSACLRIHHALVDSYSIGLIRTRSEVTDMHDYEEFLLRTDAVSASEHDATSELCSVVVCPASADDGFRVARLLLDRPEPEALLGYGAFNFWFACFCDALAGLGSRMGRQVLVPMSFRDLLDDWSRVPGLATGSVGVDVSPPGTALGVVKRNFLRSLRDRRSRLAMGAWDINGVVPIEFAYDDSSVRLARMRRLTMSAGFEVVKRSPDEYLLVCSAGVDVSFAEFNVDEWIREFVDSAERRGLSFKMAGAF